MLAFLNMWETAFLKTFCVKNSLTHYSCLQCNLVDLGTGEWFHTLITLSLSPVLIKHAAYIRAVFFSLSITSPFGRTLLSSHSRPRRPQITAPQRFVRDDPNP